MKCNNCGAPLTLLDGRSYYYCDYCATFHYPPEADTVVDGVAPLGEQTDAQCPICDISLSAGTIEGRRVAYCEKCHGVFVTNDDFAAVVQTQRAEYAGSPDEPTPINREELKRRINCPACGKVMDVHPYYGPGSVVIDSCCRCKMVWLDRGEIAAIERAPGRR